MTLAERDLRGCRVALVGGAGFIGHNLALALAARGAQVAVVDSLQVNNLLAFQTHNPDLHNRDLSVRIINERLELLRMAGIPLYVQDARDYQALCPILSDIKPQVLVHLAAVSHAGRANKDPFQTFDHSLRTLENALDAARGNVEQFIFFSSSMAYGNFQTSEVSEDHPLDPIGIYGALKAAGERLVIAYNQVFKMPFTIIRPSALYGPRCVSRRVGQIFIESALDNETLRVAGDGSERLDFTYVDDLIQGVMLAITNPNARNEIFNITYGQARSVNELISVIERSFPDVKVQYSERDALMPMRGTLSIDKAVRLLGYAPQHPIDVGIPKYIQWYRDLRRSAHAGVARPTPHVPQVM
ncbi:MAG: NAD-dependent epimerase/dehydratase family protein [Vicinamibacterales bacterium]